MTKWCLLLVVSSVLGSVHQFPSDNIGIYRSPSSKEVVDKTSFDICQNILGQIIDRLEHEEIYKLFHETGTHVNYWKFEKEISSSHHWCKTKSETTPLVQLSWKSGQNTCVNLGVFNYDGKPNFTEYICDLNTNSPNVQKGFTSLKLNSETESNVKTKRSLTRQIIQSYINLAKEVDSTECSSLTLNVYFNEKLVFSNASGVVGDDVPKDSIDVYVNVNTRSFYISIPAKKEHGYIINTTPMDSNYARSECQRTGSQYLVIDSQEKTNKVVAAMNKYQISEYWTSGRQGSYYDNDWHWWYMYDTYATYPFSNWDVGQPHRSGSNVIGPVSGPAMRIMTKGQTNNCIKIQQTGTWIDEDCNIKLPFICEGQVDTAAAEVPPIIHILVDGNVVYRDLPTENQDQSNILLVKIGLNGNAPDDHSTKFLLSQKNSPLEAASEQRLVTPKNFIDSNFNGIDIRVENIKQKGFVCEKEKFFHVHTEEKLSYIDAQKFCQNHSTQLASIQNEMQHLDIQNITLNLNTDHFYWTSGHLAVDGTTWLWSENEAVEYSNWAKGEPNNLGGNEKCMEIFMPWKTAKWNDQECQDKNFIICESFTKPYWRRISD